MPRHSHNCSTLHHCNSQELASIINIQYIALLFGLLEPFFGCTEVDDVPDCFKVVSLYILVLKVKGVLPSINANQRDVSWVKRVSMKRQNHLSKSR